VCADEDLLRAEFEEIITSEWPSVPPVHPHSGTRAGLPRRTPRSDPIPATDPSGAADRPDQAVRTRERSPPPVPLPESRLDRHGPGRGRGRDHSLPDTTAMNPDAPDLYAVLGVPPSATQTEIDHAFRTLLRQHHPDTRQCGGEAQGTLSDATLQAVFAAYSVLGDPGRRASYDGDGTPSIRPRGTRAHTAPTRLAVDRPPIVAGPVRWHPVRHARP
jgi:hypothetical protein